MKPSRRLSALLLLFLFVAPAVGFNWTLIKIDNRDYIPLLDVARFYKLNTFQVTNGLASLSNSTTRFQTQDGSRELYLNGLKFILNYPIEDSGGQLAISRMDLAKVVEPVLRPAKIRTSPPRVVVLDAGHGGEDTGARSILGMEKDYALDVVLRARELLVRNGFIVRLSRSADVFVPLETRASFASQQSNAIFVSVHFNFSWGSDAEGIETYCLAPRGVPATNDPFPSLSDMFACPGNIHDAENIALATAMHASLITRLAAPDRGIKRARFVVLRDNLTPSVLIEGGFLTNARDAVRIASPAYRQLMADAILHGILTYNHAVSSSYPPPPRFLARQRTAPVTVDPTIGSVIWNPTHGVTHEFIAQPR